MRILLLLLALVINQTSAVVDPSWKDDFDYPKDKNGNKLVLQSGGSVSVWGGTKSTCVLTITLKSKLSGDITGGSNVPLGFKFFSPQGVDTGAEFCTAKVMHWYWQSKRILLYPAAPFDSYENCGEARQIFGKMFSSGTYINVTDSGDCQTTTTPQIGGDFKKPTDDEGNAVVIQSSASMHAAAVWRGATESTGCILTVALKTGLTGNIHSGQYQQLAMDMYSPNGVATGSRFCLDGVMHYYWLSKRILFYPAAPYNTLDKCEEGKANFNKMFPQGTYANFTSVTTTCETTTTPQIGDGFKLPSDSKGNELVLKSGGTPATSWRTSNQNGCVLTVWIQGGADTKEIRDGQYQKMALGFVTPGGIDTGAEFCIDGVINWYFTNNRVFVQPSYPYNTPEKCGEARAMMQDLFPRGSTMTVRSTGRCEFKQPKVCTASSWGDPHIRTFDGVRYDAHAKGEVIFLKSLDSALEIQGRLESWTGWKGGPAVTTAVAVRDSTPDSPTIQVSMAKCDGDHQMIVGGGRQNGECPVQLFVNGKQVPDIYSGTGFANARVAVDGSTVSIQFPDFHVDMHVRKARDVCLFSVEYVLAEGCRSNERLIGLLGSPNGNKTDDWMARDGSVLSIPTEKKDLIFGEAYEYSKNNWCMGHPSESLFTYESECDQTFYDFAHCDNLYEKELEDAVEKDATPDMKELCGDDEDCLLDFVTLGKEAAQDYLVFPATTATDAPTWSPTSSPTQAPVKVKTYGGDEQGKETAIESPSDSKGAVSTCEAQSSCIDWKITPLKTDECGFGKNHIVETLSHNFVEVCMEIDTSKDQCAKMGQGISHVCDASDAEGCPNGSLESPIFDSGDGSCPAVTGQGTGSTSKCDNVKSLKMCQKGVPGSTVYFIVKDGQNTDPDKMSFGSGDKCSPSYTCTAGDKTCGGGSKQLAMERTWAFTIPRDYFSGETCEDGSAGENDVLTSVTSNLVAEPADESPELAQKTPVSGSNGDPHFKTWKEEHFEYHGQCDMILVKDDNFANGLGLEVQIRTKLVRFWSYIKSVAIRIGDDILEVEGSADVYPFPSKELLYWINLEYQGDLKTVGGFPVKSWRHGELRQHFVIDLSSKFPGQSIEVATFREFIRVEFQNGSEESYGNAVGLLGDFKSGKTLARDGVTELNDFYDYGNEWQVLPFENMLFHGVEQPQFPHRCIVPEDPRGQRRRRLDESTVSEADAEKACASIADPLDRKDCIYDILATQDLDMVGAY